MSTAPLRVTFLTPYPLDCAGGQRFRFEQWLSLLPDGSVDARVFPLLSRRTYSLLHQPGHALHKAGATLLGALKRAVAVLGPQRADVAFIHRELFPFGPPLFEAILERRVPVVFDFDDAIYLRASSEANRLVAPLKRPQKVGPIIAGAAATIAGNEELAGYARRHTDSVYVVPTTIDVEAYTPASRDTRSPDAPIRMGWSGSPTTTEHLLHVVEALRRVLRGHHAELVVHGATHVPLLDVPNVRVVPWRRSTELSEVQAFDVGIMPLPDNPWTRGKCGFKALLYMALGVPTVVSPVGVNTEIVDHDVNGLVASTTEEWVDALTRLIADGDLRRRLGNAGRATVVERYSGQRWAPRFLDILQCAAEGGRGPTRASGS